VLQLLFTVLISITPWWLSYLFYPQAFNVSIYVLCSTCTALSSWIIDLQTRAFYFQSVFECIQVLGRAAWKVKTSILGSIIKYNHPLTSYSKQNLAWNVVLGADGKSCSWKGDLAVLCSWKKGLHITHIVCHQAESILNTVTTPLHTFNIFHVSCIPALLKMSTTGAETLKKF